MKKNLYIVPILLILWFIMALPYSANAQSQYGKDWEFSLGGSGTSNKDFDTTIFSTELSLGYFLNKSFEIIVRQGIGFYDDDYSDSKWSGSTRLAFDIHFPFDRVFPYIGGSVGYVYGDGVLDSFIAGAEGGIKYFVNKTTFINAMMAYEFFFDDTDDVDIAYKDGRVVYVLSIGFRF